MLLDGLEVPRLLLDLIYKEEASGLRLLRIKKTSSRFLTRDEHRLTSKVVNGSDDPSDPNCTIPQSHVPVIHTGPGQCLILVNFDGLDRLNRSTC